MKKSKEGIAAAMEKHLPEVKKDLATARQMLDTVEVDFEEAHDCMKRLVIATETAISTLAVVAEGAEHPRAFEVLATLIKTAADLNKQILDMSKQRQELHNSNTEGESGEAPKTQNNFFVGTTTDLQKMIADAQAIDV